MSFRDTELITGDHRADANSGRQHKDQGGNADDAAGTQMPGRGSESQIGNS